MELSNNVANKLLTMGTRDGWTYRKKAIDPTTMRLYRGKAMDPHTFIAFCR